MDDDTGADGDVERMFGAVLRYLDASVGERQHILLHAADLVAEDNG